VHVQRMDKIPVSSTSIRECSAPHISRSKIGGRGFKLKNQNSDPLFRFAYAYLLYVIFLLYNVYVTLLALRHTHILNEILTKIHSSVAAGTGSLSLFFFFFFFF